MAKEDLRNDPKVLEAIKKLKEDPKYLQEFLADPIGVAMEVRQLSEEQKKQLKANIEGFFRDIPGKYKFVIPGEEGVQQDKDVLFV